MSTLLVDRISPYQSSSVTIDGFSAPNLATTGSNTFTGNQNIQGTITASIQEGFALVGGVGNVSTLVATSSFGGALPSGVVSGSSQLTASYDLRYALSGSGGGGSGFPFTGAAQITGSLGVSGATTIGGELSVTPALLPNGFPAGTGQFIIPFLSGSTNVIARDSDNALYWQPAFNVLAVSSSTGNTTISATGMTVTSGTTGSTQITTTRVVSNFGAGRNIAIAGDAESTALTGLTGITNPAIILQSGSAGLPPVFYAPIQFQASQSFTDGRVTITRPLVAQEGAQITGSVDIQNTLTASLQQGYVWVGDATGRTTTVATSSFGGGGGGATLGANTFTGDQTLIDAAGNTITLSDASGSLMLVAKTFTSASAHLTGSAGNQVNIIFKNNDNTADTIVSGSNNIFTNPSAPTADFKRIIGSNNIVNSAAGIPQVTGSMTTPITMASNYFGNSTTTLRGPITGSGYTISNNAVFGTLNIGQAGLNDVTRASGFIFTGNQVIGTMGFVATTSATLPNLASSPQATNNIVNGAVTATMNSSSVNLTTNIFNAGAFQITNNYFNGTAGTGVLTIGQNIIGGAQFTTLAAQGSNPAGTTNNPNVQGNLIYGLSNATHINGDNSRVNGSNVYTNLIATSVLGSNLAVTGSSLVSDTTTVGSAFVGRFNANDGIRNKTSDIVFAVGTGTASGTRKTGFLIDSGSNTFVEGTLNVSGSSVFTGSLILSSSATTELQVIGNTEFTGSVSIQSGSAFFANGNRQFNLGTFLSNVSQSGSANVSQSMNFETIDISQGVSIASNSRITLANSGTYNIQFSAQIIAAGGADDIYIWLKKNGTNVPATAGHIQLGNNEELIAAWNYVVDATASDYYELAWQATNAGTILLTEAATGNIPSVPSVILTVTQVR
jgi:fibronectin-binding autotransporter adhesin